MRMEAATFVFFIGCLVLNGASATNSTNTRSRASIQACIPDGKSSSIGDRASCTFTRIVDVDPSRFPSRIPTVVCKCPGLLCSTLGDFRCYEVKEQLEVIFRTRNGAFRTDTIEVTVSCVCALSRSGQADGIGVRVVNHAENRDQSAIPFGSGSIAVR
ncbi:interleukin cytokine-related protein 17.1 [Dermacentor silvarum]|uniref:interleukin cytokine-related protein 17.1 n=1 Tax=Dermacentor silvarum TaxID=543639 RepID=UPI00210192D3|nr:interleukin cytokine-related protein 17.1 [Dermacentor silvarum]